MKKISTGFPAEYYNIRNLRKRLGGCPGVKKICLDVWTCRYPRMCADRAMKVLYQFRRDEARLLLKLINDDAMWFAHRNARARGLKAMCFGAPDGRKLFVEVFQKKKRKALKSS